MGLLSVRETWFGQWLGCKQPPADDDDHRRIKLSGPESEIFRESLVKTHLPLVLHTCVSESALVQIMVCCLFGAKPLSKPMLGCCKFVPLGTNFSEVLIKIQNV